MTRFSLTFGISCMMFSAPLALNAASVPLSVDLMFGNKGKPSATLQINSRFVESNWGLSAGYNTIIDFEQAHNDRTYVEDISFVNVGGNYYYQAEENLLWVTELGIASITNESEFASRNFFEKGDVSAYAGTRFYWQFDDKWHFNIGANLYSGFGDSSFKALPFLGITYNFAYSSAKKRQKAVSHTARRSWQDKVDSYRESQRLKQVVEQETRYAKTSVKPVETANYDNVSTPNITPSSSLIATSKTSAKPMVYTPREDTRRYADRDITLSQSAIEPVCEVAYQIGHFSEVKYLNRMVNKVEGLLNGIDTLTEKSDIGNKLLVVNIGSEQKHLAVTNVLKTNNISYFRKRLCTPS